MSYLEIYNEVGYDLLDPAHHITRVEDLKRVQAFEMDNGAVCFRNLAVQPVSSEEDALNLVGAIYLHLFCCSLNQQCRLRLSSSALSETDSAFKQG